MNLLGRTFGNKHHIVFYPPEDGGNLREEGDYKKWKKHGSWIYWYGNKQKQREGSYKDGKREGLWTGWDEKGNVIDTQTYKVGELVK